MKNKGAALATLIVWLALIGGIYFFWSEGYKYHQFNRDIEGQVIIQIPRQLLTTGFPAKAKLYNLIGITLARYRDYAVAETFFKSAVILDPSDPVILANLGKLYYVTDRIREADGIGQELKKLSSRQVKKALPASRK